MDIINLKSSSTAHIIHSSCHHSIVLLDNHLQMNETTPLKTGNEYVVALHSDDGGGGGGGGHRHQKRRQSHIEEGGMTAPLAFALFVASCSQFLVGYNTGVMNPPVKVVFPGHSTLSWAVAVAAFAAGGPFGAMYAGKMADIKGRRGALILDMWLFFVGGMLQTLAPNIYVIIMARFVVGFASGFSSVVVPIYLGEMSPPNLRGSLGTITQFALTIGILFSDVLAFPFCQEDAPKWRAFFSFTPIVSIIQLVLSSKLLLESPRWQLMRHMDDSAGKSIARLSGVFNQDELQQEMERLLSTSSLRELGIELDSSTTTRKKTTTTTGGDAESKGGARNKKEDEKELTHAEIFAEMWAHGSIRILLISAVLLNMTQQLSGINAVFYYSTQFFQGVIENPLVGTTYAGAINVLATGVALIIMDKVGRKTLILWSCGGMFLSCIFVVLSLLGYFNNVVALGSVLVYVIFFEIGLGPIPWLIVSEMFAGKHVAVAQGISVQANWACNFFIGLVFPYLDLYLGPYSFGPFAVVLLTCFIYVYTLLPETKGRTAEEVSVELERMLGNRNIGKSSTISSSQGDDPLATGSVEP